MYTLCPISKQIYHTLLSPHLFGKVVFLVISVHNNYKAWEENGQPDKKSKAFVFRIYILTPLERGVLSQTCDCLFYINYFLLLDVNPAACKAVCNVSAATKFEPFPAYYQLKTSHNNYKV